MRKLKIGVLASGRGSNLQAIIESSAAGEIDVDIRVVVSDVETAVALEHARKAGIPAVYVPPGKYKTKLDPETEAKYVEALKAHDVEIIVLAGFMRVLHDVFLSAFDGRIINIHPSLLPSFPGLDVQRKALEYGVKWSGATVHFVNAGVDAGPIIVQAAVPILDDDTPETLAERILEQEHRIYPEALQLLAENRVHIEGRRVRIRPRAESMNRQ